MPLVSRYKCQFCGGKCTGLCIVMLILKFKNKWLVLKIMVNAVIGIYWEIMNCMKNGTTCGTNWNLTFKLFSWIPLSPFLSIYTNRRTYSTKERGTVQSLKKIPHGHKLTSSIGKIGGNITRGKTVL